MADHQTTIPEGFCQCGCGQKTSIALKSNTKRSWIKGFPVKYISGHNSKGHTNPKWKGGTKKRNGGYILIKKPFHPKADSQGYVLEHILVVEEFLGFQIPPNYEIHHIDGIKDNNAITNLSICPSRAIHCALHARDRAIQACGHADWRKCCYCHKWDDPQHMKIYSYKRTVIACHYGCTKPIPD